MGCAGSKVTHPSRRRRRSQAPYCRTQSLPVHNGLINSDGHIVALTSSTLGSLRLDDSDHVSVFSDDDDEDDVMKSNANISSARAWLETFRAQCKPGGIDTWELVDNNETPEMINAWELMEGLEEAEAEAKIDQSSVVVSDFEPARNSLAWNPKYAGIVSARVKAFQQEINAKRGGSAAKKCPAQGERRVVVYFTSLRGIRKTYEDCWSVRVIMQGYGVKVDERDVSMHAGFRDELDQILGAGSRSGLPLPRVFANGEYLGGADEVRAMHEAGELARALEGCESPVIAKGGGLGDCQGCGGVRFLPCETCSGSCKVFVHEEEVGGAGGGAGFRRCLDCNENGLIRCLNCL